MNDLIVIMWPVSGEKGLMPHYLKQLSAAEIDVHVEPSEEFVNTLEAQIRAQRFLVNQFSEYQKVIFSDAFDVLFFGSKDEVLSKIPEETVVSAAERCCWPDASRVSEYPGRTPWRFANGGLLAGTPKSILRWFDDLENHPLYPPTAGDFNQRLFNLLRLETPAMMPLDETTELFYCLPGEKNELGCEDGRPINRVCGTRPNFLHANNPPNWNALSGAEFWKCVPFTLGWVGDWREERWSLDPKVSTAAMGQIKGLDSCKK